MTKAKIQFSQSELELMQNSEVLLTKNIVLQKLKAFLEQLQVNMQEHVNYNHLPADKKFSIPPKISKGENYLGLPYMILDYPRIFNGEDILAIRIMFWWGNFISCTLHIAGAYKQHHLHSVMATFTTLGKEGFYIGAQEDQWQHHFENENYIAISSLNENDFKEMAQKHQHIKLAYKISLKEIDSAEAQLLNRWQLLLHVI